MFGVEIKVGDIVVYPCRQSSNLWMTMAVVSELRKDTKYVYNQETEKREPVEYFYPMIQKYIDITKLYWEEFGEKPHQDAVEYFLGNQTVNASGHKKWKLKKFEFRNYRLSCWDRVMVIDQYKARNFKPNTVDGNQLNPYIERANEILTNGARNEGTI